MKLIKSDFASAAKDGIISDDQADKLWLYFSDLRPNQAKFQALHVLYYFGGLLIFGSMSWFLTEAWENPMALMGLSAFFGLLYLFIGNYLWKAKDLKIPAGLLISAAVGLVPLFIYGLQKWTGFWPESAPENYHGYYTWIRKDWLFMEVGTVVAALAALYHYPFPFIAFPLAWALWFMSMDLTPFLFGKTEYEYYELRLASLIFGLVLLAISYIVDRTFKDKDFAFWTYLAGMLAFWGGLSLLESDTEFGKFIYFLINVGLILLGVYLRRKIIVIFGGIGAFGYLSYLAWDFFKDSYIFPIMIAFLGLLLLYLGIQFQKHNKFLEKFLDQNLPKSLIKWRPSERP